MSEEMKQELGERIEELRGKRQSLIHEKYLLQNEQLVTKIQIEMLTRFASDYLGLITDLVAKLDS